MRSLSLKNGASISTRIRRTLLSVSSLNPVPKKDSALVLPTHSWKPVLLDFSDETATKQDELAFLKDMLRKGSPELKNALGISALDTDKLVADSALLLLIESAAEVGGPEALACSGVFTRKALLSGRV